jgi:hypothetical protein
VIDETDPFNERLQEWETFYNFDRPHESLAGRDPPVETPAEDHEPGVNEHPSAAHSTAHRQDRR